MLETIRQFAEEQLVASGTATTARAAHARHFAQSESDILALWESPYQRKAYTWFTTEFANLRTAFRWAVDHDDLDTGLRHRDGRSIARPVGRKLRADSLGRRTHRASPRRRPSLVHQNCDMRSLKVGS